MRKTPIRHRVSAHQRKQRPVREYERGDGYPQRSLPHRMVRAEPVEEEEFVEEEQPVVEDFAYDSDRPHTIDYPIEAEVIFHEQTDFEYDYDEEVQRPVCFVMKLKTDEDVRGFDDNMWGSAANSVFPAFINSINAGYGVDVVDVATDPYEDNIYTISVWLRRKEIEPI